MKFGTERQIPAPIPAEQTTHPQGAPAPKFKRSWPRKGLIQTLASVKTSIAPPVRSERDSW